MKTELANLPLSAISITGGTQSRVALNQDAVADYAEVIRLGGELPPVVVFNDGASDGLWLADGFHRFHAHHAAGAMEIECDVRVGTQRDAILFSAGANAAHGLRRTNDDKRRAVSILLGDEEWSKWSDREIARVCGVGNKFVGDVRSSICVPNTDSDAIRIVERNGATYEQKTSNIGKGKPVLELPAPKASVADCESPYAHDTAQDDFGPSDVEIAQALAAEAEQTNYIKSLLENEDDPLTKALADVAQMRLLNSALKSQNDGYQATIAEQIRMIKSLRAKVAKLESLERAA